MFYLPSSAIQMVDVAMRIVKLPMQMVKVAKNSTLFVILFF